MKRWLLLPIVLTGLLMIVTAEPRSAERKYYEVIKMMDPALEGMEVVTPCYQFGAGIYGCGITGESDLWAVSFEWIRLSTDPAELIPSTEIMKMDVYSKIDTSVKRIPAYYMWAISAGSVEEARKKSLDSGYLVPPAALVDSVQADTDRVND